MNKNQNRVHIFLNNKIIHVLMYPYVKELKFLFDSFKFIVGSFEIGHKQTAKESNAFR